MTASYQSYLSKIALSELRRLKHKGLNALVSGAGAFCCWIDNVQIVLKISLVPSSLYQRDEGIEILRLYDLDNVFEKWI